MSDRKFTQGGLFEQDRRRHKVDDDFFARPPSEDRDYLLGVIATDGCIDHDRPRLRFNFQAQDRPFLERIRETLRFTGPIGARMTRGGETSGHRAFPCVSLGIQSAKLVSDLSRFGITPRKTHSLCVSGVEDSTHFWRGVIDGDGSIAFRQTRRDGGPILSLLSASSAFIEQFTAFVSGRIGRREKIKTTVPKKASHNPSYTLSLHGCRAAALARILYDDCTICLPRKLARAREAVAWASEEAKAERHARITGRPPGRRLPYH